MISSGGTGVILDVEGAGGRGQVRQTTARPSASLAEVAQTLRWWAEEDAKAAPLKELQGLIWEAGFAAGELTAHVYDDVPPALRTWTAQGQRLYVYSSGSVRAQRPWFGHTQHGDLRSFYTAHFDTQNAGPKTDPHSYATVAATLRTRPHQLTFYSDSRGELDAAAAAGWQVTGVRRPGNPSTDYADHPVITSFAQLLSPHNPPARSLM